MLLKCKGEGKCPTCPLLCPVGGCECTARNGSLLVPPPIPPQPSDCPPCPVHSCPRITCTSPNTPCTAEQLKTYVLYCPECVAQAGCRQIGCDCKDCFGNILTPPTNPPQPPRQNGCPTCSTACIVSEIKCRTPIRCTQDQVDEYVRISQ